MRRLATLLTIAMVTGAGAEILSGNVAAQVRFPLARLGKTRGRASTAERPPKARWCLVHADPGRAGAALAGQSHPCASLDPAQRDRAVRLPLTRYGLRAAGGISAKSDIQTYGLAASAGFRLPARVDQWLWRRKVSASWMVEAWGAYLRDDKKPFTTQSLEAGLNPLLLRFLFFPGAVLSPYLEGGEGIMYIDLRGQALGTRIQFASQAGAGIEVPLTGSLNLDLGYRYRHVSNLGMASNPGINTHLGLAGLSYHLR